MDGLIDMRTNEARKHFESATKPVCDPLYDMSNKGILLVNKNSLPYQRLFKFELNVLFCHSLVSLMLMLSLRLLTAHC